MMLNSAGLSGVPRLGIGVIGYGYWGPKVVRALTRFDDAELVMVSDLSEERLRGLTLAYPDIRTTTDYREVLGDPRVEAVIIATPIRTHFRLAMEALLQGKHVLVEKPLAASSVEAEELVETARFIDRRLMVGHTFQYNAAVGKLRDLVRSGELGEVYYIDCARLNLGLFQRDVNVLWDLAPHDLSILLHVLGTHPESISARGAAHVVSNVDDLAQLDLRFPGGISAHVRLSWLDPFKIRRVAVVGSRKMAVFDDMAEEKLRIYDKRVALLAADGMNDPIFDYHEGDVEVPELDWVEPLQAQISHFVECIRTDRRPISDGQVGFEVVKLIEAADASRRLDSREILLTPTRMPHLELLARRAAERSSVAEAS